jgi:hypothetical protein
MITTIGSPRYDVISKTQLKNRFFLPSKKGFMWPMGELHDHSGSWEPWMKDEWHSWKIMVAHGKFGARLVVYVEFYHHNPPLFFWKHWRLSALYADHGVDRLPGPGEVDCPRWRWRQTYIFMYIVIPAPHLLIYKHSSAGAERLPPDGPTQNPRIQRTNERTDGPLR